MAWGLLDGIRSSLLRSPLVRSPSACRHHGRSFPGPPPAGARLSRWSPRCTVPGRSPEFRQLRQLHDLGGTIKPYFRNLADCTANGAGGYGCRRGEVLRTEVGKPGRNFCSLDNVWYDPTSRTVQYNVGTCQYKSDQQRLQEQGQQWLQKGLNLLENQGGR